jgi:hypothetical protein
VHQQQLARGDGVDGGGEEADTGVCGAVLKAFGGHMLGRSTTQRRERGGENPVRRALRRRRGAGSGIWGGPEIGGVLKLPASAANGLVSALHTQGTRGGR